MRRMFRKNIEDNSPDPTGKIVARISIDKVDAKTSKVKGYAVSRDTGKTVYKLRYVTSERSGTAIYYTASEYLKQFARDNGYIIDGEIVTNIELPYAGVVRSKRGYSR